MNNLKKLLSVHFLCLFFAAALNGATAERLEFKKKDQWNVQGKTEFGDDIFRNSGKTRMISKEILPVNPAMVWQLRGSVRSTDGSGRIRLGFLPLDAAQKTFRDSTGKELILWCTPEIRGTKRWKDICGGISAVENPDFVHVKWIKNVKFARLVLESSGKIDIVEFGLEKLEE